LRPASPRSSTDATHDAGALIARLESVPFSRWHRKARIVIGTATFFDAFDALSIAFALPVLVGLWQLSQPQIGLLISASYVGQLLGALTFGSLAERFGRIPSATGAIALMAVMGFACAGAGSYQTLLAFRFLQGIGIGGEMPVAAAYINELSRAQGRGRFFLLYEMIFPLGLMATGQIGALVVPALGWRSMFLAGAVPGVVIAVLASRLAESPRWLIAKNRLADAAAVIGEIEASTPERVAAESPAQPSVTAAAQPTRWAELMEPLFRTRTAVVWLLWASAYFVTNGLNNWMPTLYHTIYGLDLQHSLRAASMNNVAQVALLLVCAFVIDRIGRRSWVTAGFVVGGAALALLGLSGAGSVVTVLVLGTLSYGVVGSINAVLYLYTPEIYPTRMRAIGTGAATSWLRLASAVAPLAVGYLVGAYGIGSVFLMFAGVAAIGLVAATRMIETRNRRLEDIAQ
jgi:MFS transporter, putative metabolite:H+ symporter